MTISQDTNVPNTNRGPLLLKLEGSLVGLGALTLCLRFYTRAFIKKSLGWDDFFILLGWIGFTVGFVFVCLQVQYGFGRHAIYVSQPAIIQVGKWTLANEIQITFTLTFVKLSACVFVFRMMEDAQKAIQRIIYVLSILLVLLGVTSILVLCLQCFPLSHFYDPAVPGKCIASEVPQRVFQTYSVVGTIVDFSYVLLPALVLKSLNMQPQLKYGIIALLALAVFPATASIIKIVLTDYTPADLTWDLVNVELWNCLEAGFGIIIASLPSIRPLMMNFYSSASQYVTSAMGHRQIESSEVVINLEQRAAIMNHVEIQGDCTGLTTKDIMDSISLSSCMDIGVRRDTIVTVNDPVPEGH